MHYGWPGGMEEDVVRCMLRQALKGLKLVLSPCKVQILIMAVQLSPYQRLHSPRHKGRQPAHRQRWDCPARGLRRGRRPRRRPLRRSPAILRPPMCIAYLQRHLVRRRRPPALSLRTNTAKAHHDSKPRIGKRKSFVGTVWVNLLASRPIFNNLCSPVGWHPELIQGKTNTTPKPTYGASASQLWS